MTRETFPEPDALRRACKNILEQLDANGPWLAPDIPELNDLAAGLRAYYHQTRRMFRITRSLAACIKTIESCDRLNAEVRKSVLAAIQGDNVPGSAKLEQMVPLLEQLTQSGEAVNALTNESPLRARVASMRALEDACLKLLDSVNEPAAPAAAPSAPAEESRAAEITAPPPTPAPAAGDTRNGSRSDIPIVTGPGSDGRPIPRLSVGKLVEFLGGQKLPEGAVALSGWTERNPDDTMPNSWIQAGGCPTCSKDVLIAFGKSRKETIFCQGGHVLKFNQAQALVQV